MSELKPLVGNGNRADEFVRCVLLNAISLDAREAESFLLNEVGDSSYQKYFNGKNRPQKAASVVLANLDRERFETWLSEFGSDTLDLVAEAIAPYSTDVSPVNVAKIVTDLLVETLDDAARATRGKKPKSSLSKQDPSELALMVSQAHGRCPLCGARFKKGKTTLSGAVVDIEPPSMRLDYKEHEAFLKALPQELDNTNDLRIALCLNCAEAYGADPTKDATEKLVASKRQIVLNERLDDALAQVHLGEEVVSLISKLANCDASPIESDVSMMAVKVNDKMRAPGGLLASEVISLATSAYQTIRDGLASLEADGTLRSEIVASRVRSCYLELSALNLTQDMLFERMATWVAGETGSCDPTACRALVAFYVQDCEVFDALAK